MLYNFALLFKKKLHSKSPKSAIWLYEKVSMLTFIHFTIPYVLQLNYFFDGFIQNNVNIWSLVLWHLVINIQWDSLSLKDSVIEVQSEMFSHWGSVDVQSYVYGDYFEKSEKKMK